MNSSALGELIMDKMEANGLQPRNPLADGKSMAIWLSVAEAVVEHIQNNAKAVVASGSSAGQWPIV
jgi:hypothetical protein